MRRHTSTHTNSCLKLHRQGDELTDSAATHTTFKDRWGRGKTHHIHRFLVIRLLMSACGVSGIHFPQILPRGILQVAKSTKSEQLTGTNKVSAGNVVWGINQSQSPSIHHQSSLTSPDVKNLLKLNTYYFGALIAGLCVGWTDITHRICLYGTME